MKLSIPEKIHEMIEAINNSGIDKKQELTLMEVGCANGSTTVAMADAMRANGFALGQAVGIDIERKYVEEAQQAYGSQSGVSFHFCSAAGTWPCKPDVVIMSSVLHEIESYTFPKDNRTAVPDFFAKLYREMPAGSVGVIRDFVAPANGDAKTVLYHCDADVQNIVSKGVDKSDHGKKLTFAYLIERFKASGGTNMRDDFYCRKLADPRTKGLPVREGFTAYETNQKSAYRFVFGKNYADMFTAEMNENYGFATENRYKEMLAAAGFQIVHTMCNPGDWIQDNRIKDNVQIYSAKSTGGWQQHEKLPFDYQIVIGFKKPKPQTQTQPERLPDLTGPPPQLTRGQNLPANSSPRGPMAAPQEQHQQRRQHQQQQPRQQVAPPGQRTRTAAQQKAPAQS